MAGLVSICSLAGAGPPFLTDDPVTVAYQAWEINTALSPTLLRGGGTGAWPGMPGEP